MTTLPITVNLSRLIDKSRYAIVSVDFSQVNCREDIFKILKLKESWKYEFIVNGQVVSFEKLKELKGDTVSHFGLFDTYLDKTKEELEADFIKIGKCYFILEEEKQIKEYLQFYKFKGYESIKFIPSIDHSIIDNCYLFMSYELLTYQDIEERMDIGKRKIIEMEEEIESLVNIDNAKTRRRIRTLTKRIEEAKRGYLDPCICPVYPGHKRRNIPWYSNIKFPQMNFFCYNKTLRKPILINERDEDFSRFFISKMKESGALICGGYALSSFFQDGRSILKNWRTRRDDIDIFSYNLTFLREILRYFLSRSITFKITCFKFFRLDSYKISDIKDLITINIVHLGDTLSPEDLVDLTSDLNRKKIMDFMCERFDISACITCHDGEKFHYNDSIENKLFDCRYSTKVRVNKYVSRGFTVNEKLESNKEFDQALYSNRPEDS